MEAIEHNYTAWRSAPWGGDTGNVKIIVLGEDLSAATFKWLFCDEEGAAAVITLDNAAAGSQGVSVSYDANYIHPTSGAVVGATTIVPQIDEATLESLTFDGANPLTLFHMLYVTPSGSGQYVERFGNLTIRKGAPD